ncbi:hypothetical protein [Ectobacillus polymachus]|uniref:hypothetical protein n=1 Tax=Ectobacillus polymachus TaxID=1508806 RepID=UPI003A8B3998
MNEFSSGSECFSHRSRRSNNIIRFLRRLTPGTRVVLQYDDQRPASGVFQGFQNGNVILTNFNGFPGLVHIAVNRINAVSVGTTGSKNC